MGAQQWLKQGGERERKQGLSKRTVSNGVNKAGKHFLIDLNPARTRYLDYMSACALRAIVSSITLRKQTLRISTFCGFYGRGLDIVGKI